MRLFIYLILLCFVVPSSYALENSDELSLLASQYVQGELSSTQVERQIKNRLPTAIPIFIETINGSTASSARKQELLRDLSQAILHRSTVRQRLVMPASIAAFVLLQASAGLTSYYDMSNDPFYWRHPELMYQSMVMWATAFTPAFSAFSIPAGLIPLRGQMDRNNAISALDKCSLLLINETLLSEAP